MIKPKKSVEDMTGYDVAMYEKICDIKIDGNENNYGPSQKVIEAVKNFHYKDICFYPFYGELTEKIAKYRGCDFENIKVTNGADEALQVIITAYAEKGDALLTVTPSFSMPEIYINIQGGKVIKIPYEKRWEFPCDKFTEALKNSEIKIVYVSTPNNPTGNTVTKSDIIKILDSARDKVVIADETYANYSGKIYDDLIKDYDNLFIVRSFSKDFALAGLRLGYVISAKENINVLKKVTSPYSVNGFALKAGIAALSDIPYFDKIKSETDESKLELKAFFERLGAEVYDSEANFLLTNFGEKAEYVYRTLLNSGISVKMFAKGSSLENHLRVTIPTREGVEKIKEALKTKPSFVFDMDGVLIDASASFRIAIQKVYEHYTGKTVTSEEIREIKNKGGMNNDWDLTHYLLKKAGKDVDYQELVDVFNGYYWGENGLVNNEKPLFGKQYLEELAKKYNLSIFTGRTKKEAEYALNRFDVADLFYPVITEDDVKGKGKPEPDGLLLTKKRTTSSKYYYFGDTIDDMKSAKSAGYIAVGVLPPQDKSDELKKILTENGASYILNSVEEAKNISE